MKRFLIYSLILLLGSCGVPKYNPPMGGGSTSIERLEAFKKPLVNNGDTTYIDTFVWVKYDTVIDYTQAEYWQGLTRRERRKVLNMQKAAQKQAFELDVLERKNEALQIKLENKKEVQVAKYTKRESVGVARQENKGRDNWKFWIGFILAWLISFIWKHRSKIFKR